MSKYTFENDKLFMRPIEDDDLEPVKELLKENRILRIMLETGDLWDKADEIVNSHDSLLCRHHPE